MEVGQIHLPASLLVREKRPGSRERRKGGTKKLKSVSLLGEVARRVTQNFRYTC